MFKLSKPWKITAVVCAFIMLTAGIVYASTYINVHDGPTWQDAQNRYRTGVCSDTAFGETVCVQYTTDGTDLSFTGNNPSSWNGTKTACAYENSTTCTHYWYCDIPETANATINYRFYVVNQTAGGNCSYNGDVYYGQGTSQSSFTTGPNAVTLFSLNAASPLPAALPWLVAAGVALAGMAAVVRRQRR